MPRKKLSDRTRMYVIVWPGDEDLQLQFDGELFWVPSRDHSADPRDRSKHWRMPSATTPKGEFIPGTIVVKDEYAVIDGNRIKRFDAYEMVTHLESVSGEKVTQRGLAVVESWDEVAEAMAEGRPLYEASRDREAEKYLQDELARRAELQRMGQPVMPSSSEPKVKWAIAHLQSRGLSRLSAIETDAIRAALSGNAAPAGPAVPRPPIAPATPVAAELASAEEIFEQAANVGLTLKKPELEGLLRGDVETRKAIAEQIKKRTEDVLGAVKAAGTDTQDEGAPASA